MPLQLNDSQKDFCKSTAQCIRLLAPAGCGKTASLLYRCLHLLRRAGNSSPRFLVVTFTKTATVELLDRLNGDSEFEDLRARTNVTTLNAYGWRRIRSSVSSPRLLSTPADRHFALRNQLHPVWQKNEHLEDVVGKRGNAPRTLMLAMDNLKSMGFDHTAHGNFDTFSEHLDGLQLQQLEWRVDEQYELLASIGVLDERHVDAGSDEPRRRRHFYDRFFKFWRASTKRLLEESTFTFEDQKYWCYLDLAEANANQDAPLLSGATRYNHVFVDEFQDINPLDLALIREMVERNRALEDYRGPKLSGRTHAELHDSAANYLATDDVASALKVIGHDFAGLQFDTERAEDDVFYTDPPLEQLASIAETEALSADDLIDRIETVKLHVQEYRALDAGHDEDDLGVLGRPLHLMTATRAKGKEFDTVILLDTVQGIWPHNKAIDARQLEAERRLFYVAFTRAKSRVVLLCSTDSGIRSQFVDELGL